MFRYGFRRENTPADNLNTAAAVAGRLLVIGMAAAALFWLVHRLQLVVLAVVLGLAQAAVLRPAVRWLSRHGVPRPLAAVLAVGGIGSMVAALAAAAVRELLHDMPRLRAAWERVSVPRGGIAADVLEGVRRHAGALANRLAAAVGESALSGVSMVGSLVAMLGVSVVFSVFALSSGPSLWRAVTQRVSASRRPAVRAAGEEALRVAGSWFYASTLTALVDGLGVGLGLALLRVPLAGAVGILTFLLSYFPMVGAVIAGAAAVLVALIFEGPGTACAVALIVLAVQQVESHVLFPLLIGRAVRFHPIVILLLTTTMSVLLGVVGMLLAIPVAGAAVAAVNAYRQVARNASPGATDRPGRSVRAARSRVRPAGSDMRRRQPGCGSPRRAC